MKHIPVRQIKTASPEPVTSGRFKIRAVAEVLGGKDLVHDLHRHDFFFVLALEKGAGTHEIDFTPYTVHDHSIFMLRPGQVHRLELKAESTGYLMEFAPTFYQPGENLPKQRLIRAGNKNFCAVEVGRFEKLHALLAYMFNEFTEKQEGYVEVIKANLDIFFIELIRQSRSPNGTPGSAASSYAQERLEEFLELLRVEIADRKQVSQYAEQLNLSTYQLNAITKSTMGRPASDLINEQVILEAKRQLLATHNQVKEIADHLGYDDISYFIRFFKKHTGSSPEAFRKNFR
jgi:AraC family transcriptional activator of pobA